MPRFQFLQLLTGHFLPLNLLLLEAPRLFQLLLESLVVSLGHGDLHFGSLEFLLEAGELGI